MAVYKRTYKTYEGALTPAWSRFLILPRSAYGRVMQTKFFLMYLVSCFFFPLGCAAYIYLSHNTSALGAMSPQVAARMQIDDGFFEFFCGFQGGMAVLLTAFIGPGLVAPDLANNALPLYFCRPFSRAEYVLGKMSLLLAMLSVITWVPGLLLFLIQASLASTGWVNENAWIARSILEGLLIWDVVLCLIALALSAWIKWRIAAGGAILALFFAGAGFATAINSIVRTQYGSLFDLRKVIGLVFSQLFRNPEAPAVPFSDAWITLALVCVIALRMLAKRVKAFEVVK
jgi:ABC-2 type transport system permease protein